MHYNLTLLRIKYFDKSSKTGDIKVLVSSPINNPESGEITYLLPMILKRI